MCGAPRNAAANAVLVFAQGTFKTHASTALGGAGQFRIAGGI